MRSLERFKPQIMRAKNIVITTHLHPDADGIGSEIGLCLALKQLGKNVICVNEKPLLERYHYLDSQDVVVGFQSFVNNKPFEHVDLLIVVDTNSLPRIGQNLRALGKKAKDLLFIDHHPCAKELAALHCIDSSMAATGELVGHLIHSLNLKLTREIALPLYTAILIDTSSFRYPTVSSTTHRLIAELMETGVAAPRAYNKIYGTKKISYIKMLGAILTSAETTDDGSIAWLVVTEEILENFQVDAEDTHGLINNLLILDNVKVACMFRQIGETVKISLRSAGNTDVGIMAQGLGGGGHSHSAATIIEGKMDEVIKESIEKLKIMLEG